MVVCGVCVCVCVCVHACMLWFFTGPSWPGGRTYVRRSGGGETTFTETPTYVILFVLRGEHRVIKPKTHSMCDHGN